MLLPRRTSAYLSTKQSKLQWLPVVVLGGDVATFVAFAALGTNQHHEAGGVLAVMDTAWPFMAGWVLVAPLRRALRLEFGHPVAAGRGILQAWPLAWLVALAFRAGLQHRGIPLSFDLVALSVNLVFLVGWRSVLSIALGGLPAQEWPSAQAR
jgi:hypothetical protein